jgi:hypothetical protein
MKLAEIAEKLDLQVRTGGESLDVDVRLGYASDLLSDVMAHARESDVWITLQTHQNIVAVAVMKSLAGIILVNGREPEEAAVRKATAEGIPLLISRLSTFDLIGKLFELGIKGS